MSRNMHTLSMHTCGETKLVFDHSIIVPQQECLKAYFACTIVSKSFHIISGKLLAWADHNILRCLKRAKKFNILAKSQSHIQINFYVGLIW
jgi:hypothetical protein